MIPYIHLRFIIETEIPINNYFPEALIRGGFGHQLKKIVCLNKKSECNECFLNRSCIFAILFINNPVKNIKSFKNINTIPRPYSFFVHRSKGRTKDINFELILFRDAFNYIPHIIWAFFQMGENGFGRDRVGYVIKDIIDFSNNKSIYLFKDKKLGDAGIINFDYTFKDFDYPEESFILNIISPTRIHKNNKFDSGLSFRDIIKYSMIRGGLLTEFYGESSNVFDYEKILKLADDVEMVERDLKWVKQMRFSESQEKKLSMGGVIGSIKFFGQVELFKEILKIPEIFGIGKNTTFGCGRIVLVK